MTFKADLIIFTMAGHSGMGRFASEMARAANTHWNGDVVLIAPEMEHEPTVSKRVPFSVPKSKGMRIGKIIFLLISNISGALKVLMHARRGHVMLMIDVFPTVPLSILPVFFARMMGATCVLNMHDFYPHSLRFPRWLRRFELGCYRFVYRRFDLIAVMKPDQVGRLVEEAGVETDRVFVIEHGAFPVLGIVPPLGNDPVCVLVFGSLRENKRVLESIEAVHLLRDRGLDVKLRIAGMPRRGDAEYWARCADAIASLMRCYPGSVELAVDYIPDEELPLVMSGIDAFLCPYEGFDSQSGVSISAVSNGIPLIASAAARVEGFAPIAEVQTPVTSSSIAAAITKFVTVPRTDRRAHARIMRDQFELRDHWGVAIERLVTALGAVGALRNGR